MPVTVEAPPPSSMLTATTRYRFAAFVVVWFHAPVNVVVFAAKFLLLAASNRICGLDGSTDTAAMAHCDAAPDVHDMTELVWLLSADPPPENGGTPLLRLKAFV